jgi:II/X family phage/plasmid replication protein
LLDWVTAELPCEHKPLASGSILKVNPDGSIDWESPCRKSVTGSWESSIQIKSTGANGQGMATHLQISGNPSKYLQGHNIFGSDDILTLVNDTFQSIIKIQKMTPTDTDIDQVQKGEYRISRIDINYMFELGNRGEVNAWLRAAEYTSKTRHGRPALKGGTIYWGKNSRRWAVKAYCKAEEIEKHQLPHELLKTPLVEYVQNKLRIEVVLRQKELIENDLITAKNIKERGLRALFNKYVARIEMSEQIRLSDKQLLELPHKLRATYVHWQNGEHLGSLLTRPTFYRHRKELLEYGIDITTTRPKKNAANVVPLIRVLEASPAEIPTWAYLQGLIHRKESA